MCARRARGGSPAARRAFGELACAACVRLLSLTWARVLSCSISGSSAAVCSASALGAGVGRRCRRRL